jgi:tetratricopeptide (TPR) repeat protein
MKLIALLFGLVFFFAATAPAFADAKDDLAAAKKASFDGKREDALQLFTKAIDSGKLSPADLASAYNGRATIYTETKQHELAIVDFTKAIEIAPKDYMLMLYGNRGRTALTIKKFDMAIADFGKIIELKAGDSGLYFAYIDRCDAYLKAGKKAEAAADCRKALELKPGNKDAEELLRKAEAS